MLRNIPDFTLFRTSPSLGSALLESSTHELSCIVGALRRSFWQVPSQADGTDQPVDNTTSVLEHPTSGRKVHLLGCIHASEENAKSIRSTILSLEPATVVLPICSHRYNCIKNDTPAFPPQVFKEFEKMLTDAGTMPTAVTPKSASKVVRAWFRGLGFEPDVALKSAVKAAEAASARVVCAEDHVMTIMQESAQAQMSIPDAHGTLMQRLRSTALSSSGPMKEFMDAAQEEGLELGEGPEQLELLRTRRTARALVKLLEALLPETMEVIVGKRDEQMTAKLLEAAAADAPGGPQGAPVVGVTGLLHLDGVELRFVESHMNGGNVSTVKELFGLK